MTWFASLRTPSPFSSVNDVIVLDDAGQPDPNKLRAVPDQALAQAVAGRDIVFVAHGFNVSQSDGVRTLAVLEAALRTGVGNAPPLGANVVFFGVLWPGDAWIPVVNYPFEGSTAMRSGTRLAEFCARRLRGARSFAFLSHSLGARVILQAAAELDRDPALLCMTAAAVNANALDAQFRTAARRTGRVYNLASRKDQVLRLAFPVGDFFGDLLNANDGSHFVPALGRSGARPANAPAGLVDRAIPEQDGYDHGNYLPSKADPRWQKVATFMAEALVGQSPSWP